MLDIDNGYVLDPIEPIIDPDIGEQCLYKEYTLSAGSYYGDFLSEIMSSFGCDIYYDDYGRLRVERVFNDDIPYWYVFKNPAYDFRYNELGYISPTITGELTGVNKIIVQTDNTETKNASYTAINTNPRSPLCYDKIGARTYRENGGIVYISAGDSDIDTPKTQCKEYAEYMLMKETCLDLSLDFSMPPIPHIRVDDVITVTDKSLGCDGDGFLIQSLTEPFGAGEVSVSAVNLKYLPTDVYITSNHCELSSNQFKYTLSYDLNGGIGKTPASSYVTDGAMVKVAGNSISEDGKESIYAATGIFDKWRDLTYEVGLSGKDSYTPFKYMSMPDRNVILAAEYLSCAGSEFVITYKSASENEITYSFYSIYSNNKSNVIHVRDNITGTESRYRIPQEGSLLISDAFTDSTFTFMTTSDNIENISYTNINYTIEMLDGSGYSVTFPTQMSTVTLSSFMTELGYHKLALPQICDKIEMTGTTLCNNSNLEEIVFPTECGEITISGAAINSNGSLKSVEIFSPVNLNGGSLLLSNTILATVTFNSSISSVGGSILCGNNSLVSVVFNGDLSFSGGSVLMSNNALQNLTFAGSVVLQNSAGLIANCVDIESLTFGGAVTITGSSMLTSNSKLDNVTFSDNVIFGDKPTLLCGNNALTTVKFLKDVAFDAQASGNIGTVLCGNLALKDVYFFGATDFVNSISSGAFLGGHSAELTIHGLSGSPIETYAAENSISFIALTEEEINGNVSTESGE